MSVDCKLSLDFGTGGIRAVMGEGSDRLNIATINIITQGVATYMINFGDVSPRVVVAYDSRHNSKEFAREVALTLCTRGIKVSLFDDVKPTPLLSYAVRQLKCNLGIVITASHNPKQYNGYKVYNSSGAQLSTRETGVLGEIIRNGNYSFLDTISEKEAIEKGLLSYLGEELDYMYVDRLRISLDQYADDCLATFLRTVYTPLHGVGGRVVSMAMERFGVKGFQIVEEQASPDGDFPTVVTSNPEEEEAYDISICRAREIGADIILATDPDCDRVGVIVRHNGEYIRISGNQIGVLLLDYILGAKQATDLSKYVIIKTQVTSDLGEAIANKYGIRIANTYTGFKNIAELIGLLDEHEFLFGYEESCGYLYDSFVRDKDGVIGCILISAMASKYKSIDKTLIDRLEEMYLEYGYYKDALLNYNLFNMGIMNEVLDFFVLGDNLREITGGIKKIEDYRSSKLYCFDSDKYSDLGYNKTDMIRVILDCGWVAIRPSGTEPKLKIYISINCTNPIDASELIRELKLKIDQIMKRWLQ